MTTPKILLHTQNTETARRIVQAEHPDIEPILCQTYAALSETVAEHQPEVVFSNRFDPRPFPREALIGVSSVRWVSNGGSGVNHLMPWDPTEVTVTNSAGVAADAMAQFALGTFLHFAMDVPGLQRDQAARRWDMTRAMRPLDGAVLLIVGLGKTGSRMAALGSALGMHVIGMRARPKPTPHVADVIGPDGLMGALPKADYILVCLPLLDTTRGLLGEDAFAAVKPGAVLTDVSRGGIVDPWALSDAIHDGRLRGAALDVFDPEPLPSDSPFWHLPNVLISPHCSGVYEGWEEKSLQMFSANLKRWRNDEPLMNVVDPTRGY